MFITTIHNESVEFHVLSIEGSDKTRIRRTKELHTYVRNQSTGLRAKGVPVRTGFDTQEKSAVRVSLIRWKTVRFSIEDRVIAHSVFAPDCSGNANLGKTLIHANNSTRKFLCKCFVHVQLFGSSVI